MPRTRVPLPKILPGPSVASDWATGDVSQDVVYRYGKWWTAYHFRQDRRDLERDRERVRRNQRVSRFMGAQGTDPGL